MNLFMPKQTHIETQRVLIDTEITSTQMKLISIFSQNIACWFNRLLCLAHKLTLASMPIPYLTLNIFPF